MKLSPTPPQSQLHTTYRYKCVDCGAKNLANDPATDNMLHCQRCGWSTVQVLEAIRHRTGK